MTEIPTAYVSAAIDELVNVLGIKENLSIATVSAPLKENKPMECIQLIAKHLGLPCKFTLSVDGKFESKQIVIASKPNQGTSGITAQVHIPNDLPLYGTAKLQGFPISITISGDCMRNPETFVAVLAHELSHVVLRSLWHNRKDNEIYTDLTAMVLGFSEIIKKGRKTVATKQTGTSTTTTTTTTYGYLPDTLFDFAFEKVQQTLKRERKHHVELQENLLLEIAACSRQLAAWKKQLPMLRNLLCDLDKNPQKRIKKEDVERIVQMHELDFLDKAEANQANKAQELKIITDAAINAARETRHYTRQEQAILQTHLKKLEALNIETAKGLDTTTEDTQILKRNQGFFSKL